MVKVTCSQCLCRTGSPYHTGGHTFCPTCFQDWVSHPEKYSTIGFKDAQSLMEEGSA